jgi:hypothetical protein
MECVESKTFLSGRHIFLWQAYERKKVLCVQRDLQCGDSGSYLKLKMDLQQLSNDYVTTTSLSYEDATSKMI